jgi:NAD(P)-dependent dehydrogenase (short-subunit alcohol dehydrogenase family)
MQLSSCRCKDTHLHAEVPANNTPPTQGQLRIVSLFVELGTAAASRRESNGQAVAPLWYTTEHGRLCGPAGMIGYSAYCPSKFAVRGLAESLRNEVGSKLQQAQHGRLTKQPRCCAHALH